MSPIDYDIPVLDHGRFFISPILGCTGNCGYCYLDLKGFKSPQKNMLTKGQIINNAEQTDGFVFGRNATIISVGAWGDLFPFKNEDKALISHSVEIIQELLTWGNPVQIMSKNSLDPLIVESIAQCINYPEQLLYSTIITSLDKWKCLEPGTASPVKRLETCRTFHDFGITTNVLIKPFFQRLIESEIDAICDLLINNQVDYCTLGIMYCNSDLFEKISRNRTLRDVLKFSDFSFDNNLDCNGEIPIQSTQIEMLRPYVNYFRGKGIPAFLKSSCVSSNLLQRQNPSNYFLTDNSYCIQCGNCNRL